MTLGSVLDQLARRREREAARLARNPFDGLCPASGGKWSYFFPMRREDGTISVMVLAA